MRLPFLRAAATRGEPLVVSMSGARLGDAVLFAGQSAALALPLAARTGLSGRCRVVGRPESTAALEAAATRDGLLIETADRFPTDRSFELAVVEAVGEWIAAAAGAREAVRGGGRIVVVARSARQGLLAWFSARSPEISAEAIVDTLSSQGWQRTRPIGGRDGLQFVEAFA
ncbi:MAG: hypothetical protein JJE40_12305 [Vicinamibacteria bacterium]|nr:hypothetical protein [Vicinamibacteria bacterium]